jgi:hypothetical protein
MMYRRQLSEQLQDHFQAYAPLSESRIQAVYHRLRFTEYDFVEIPPNALLVILLPAKMMACVTVSARVCPLHWRAVHGCQTVSKQLNNGACSNLVYS